MTSRVRGVVAVGVVSVLMTVRAAESARVEVDVRFGGGGLVVVVVVLACAGAGVVVLLAAVSVDGWSAVWRVANCGVVEAACAAPETSYVGEPGMLHVGPLYGGRSVVMYVSPNSERGINCACVCRMASDIRLRRWACPWW